MPEPHAEPVFRAQGLTKIYRMGDVEVHALRGVDLELRAGEFVVLLGPSGSGKSTLLNILGCLDQPSEGSYRVAGRETSRLAADALAITGEQPLVRWEAEGELVEQKGGSGHVWLHLSAEVALPLTCQRCLTEADIPLYVDRSFRFVPDEETAELEDDDSDEDQPQPGGRAEEVGEEKRF